MYGCAVYTGRDTKMSKVDCSLLTLCYLVRPQNSKLGTNKFSTVEVTMNKVLLAYILLLLAEIVLCTSLK